MKKQILVGALVAGAGVASAVASLLLAPKSGKELRSDVRQKAKSVKAKASEVKQAAVEFKNTVLPTKAEVEAQESRIVAMSFCEPRSCRLQLSS